MSSVEVGILIVIAYLCIMPIVKRICECKEKVALAKSFTSFTEAQAEKKKGDE